MRSYKQRNEEAFEKYILLANQPIISIIIVYRSFAQVGTTLSSWLADLVVTERLIERVIP